MNTHIRCIIIICILTVGVLFSTFYVPASLQVTNSLDTLPVDVKGWQFTRDIQMSPETYEALNPTSLVFREYVNTKGEPLDLVVVYHQNSRWGAHAPIICYTSQGWEVIRTNALKNIKFADKDFPINEFMVKKGKLTRLVYYYWFSSNKKITASRNQQMIDMIFNGILYGYSESGFVRISMQVMDVDNNIVERELSDFTENFTPLLKDALS